MQTVKEESYQAIFRKYYPRMFYYAKRIVGEDAADDVVQEAFLELWNRMDALETDVPHGEHTKISLLTDNQRFTKSPD